MQAGVQTGVQRVVEKDQLDRGKEIRKERKEKKGKRKRMKKRKMKRWKRGRKRSLKWRVIFNNLFIHSTYPFLSQVYYFNLILLPVLIFLLRVLALIWKKGISNKLF